MGYRRWDDDYWEGEVRDAIGRNYLLCDVWHWLVCSVNASSIGVYRVPFRQLAAGCYLDNAAEAKRAVMELYDVVGPLGRMKYDEPTGWVWIVNAARKQHDPINRPEDKRRRGKSLMEELSEAAKSPFWGEFSRAYAAHLCLTPVNIDCDNGVTFEGPPKVLRRSSEGPPKVIPEGSQITSEGDPDPNPSQPIPTQPLDRAYARTSPEPPMTTTREPRWSESIAEPAIRRYCQIVESTGRYPVGDPDQAFERAAIHLRDAMHWPEGDIGTVLLRIVEFAAKDREFRAHPKHGDLFLKVDWLVGSRPGKGPFTVDVRLPEWMNKLKGPVNAGRTDEPGVIRPREQGPAYDPDLPPPTETERAEIARILKDGAEKLRRMKEEREAYNPLPREAIK